ncbi:photosystem I reaction center subunit VIII [Rippkaea orientalis PCC 8801]|uniref:Photosystem I reaction center subunit VIII n=1 Tax=Rippkaea orientalis (strain PCC 8801 / RF-1) TaxID=41431 RepID=B7K596_RIPO1|nr:photosystem I reaction center subunit VIII [Rippkaea orientalis PCC 8801]
MVLHSRLKKQDHNMIGNYAASYLPVIFVPLMAVLAFTVMGLLFIYVESEA